MSGSIPSSFACARVQESAARADSFITSPSDPVSVRPVPAIRDASTKSTSPPAGVQASPMATPGSWCALPFPRRGSSAHRASRRRRAGDGERLLVALGPPPRGLSADRPDLAFEIADARFARVAENHLPQAPSVKVSVRTSGRGSSPACDEVIARDLQLLLLGVAGQLEHFHAVAQGRRNGSSTLAVVMKSTSDRSNGTSR